MIKLLFLTLFLLHNGQVRGATSVTRQNDINNGPISNVMENLAIHTSTVTDELLAQLSTKIERTTKNLVGNIEVVVASALNQLSSPIMEAQNKINSADCQAALSMDELQQRIDISLMTCTQNLTNILTTFETDAQQFSTALETSVKEIIDLPNQCKVLNNSSGLAATLSCYVDKIADINQQIAIVLNRASLTLVHTRQLAEQGLIAARSCADEVVVDTLEYLNDILLECDITVN